MKGSPAAQRNVWKTILPVVGVFVASGGLLAVVLGTFSPQQTSAPVLPDLTQAAAPAPQGAQAVDLSTMTPRQAADRLFNRVMAAYEGNNTAEAEQFGPMALEAYKLVESLDADAQYHVGLINFVLGNMDEVRKQIAILRQASPEHLLAATLEIRVAKQAGDEKAAAESLARGAAAYEAEMKTGRPEYAAHRVAVDRLRISTPD